MLRVEQMTKIVTKQERMFHLHLQPLRRRDVGDVITPLLLKGKDVIIEVLHRGGDAAKKGLSSI